MLMFLARRIGLAAITLIGVATITFFMLRVVPGDIVEIKLRGDGGNVTQEQVDKERKRLGLDRPLAAQFVAWGEGLLRLDLGESMWTGTPVTEEIRTRLPLTLEVAILATIIAVTIAIPLGLLGALYRGTWIDHVVQVVSVAGLSVPPFWLGMAIILALLALFNWVPPLVFTPFMENPVANLSQLIWPALAVGYRYSATVTRMLRSSIIEVMGEDYIRTARAKGLRERIVVARHALRNALLPTITIVGLEFAFLIGGLVVTEQVFTLNGIGRLFVQAVSKNDFIMIQGIIMLIAAMFVAVNLLVDILYAVIDPRIRVT